MFKKNFVRLCNIKGVPPTTVCIEIGLNKSTFSNWDENSIPRQATLEKLADYFGVTTDYLVNGEVKTENTLTSDSNAIGLTSKELHLIQAYRSNPEMQEAVNRLLGLSEDKKVITPKLKDPTALVAAKGGGIKNSPSEDDGEGITM